MKIFVNLFMNPSNHNSYLSSLGINLFLFYFHFILFFECLQKRIAIHRISLLSHIENIIISIDFSIFSHPIFQILTCMFAEQKNINFPPTRGHLNRSTETRNSSKGIYPPLFFLNRLIFN